MSVQPNFESPLNLREIRARIAQTDSGTSLLESVKTQWPLFNNEQVIHIVRSLDPALGILEPLNGPLSDERVTDIVINGHNEVWIDDGESLKNFESPWNNEIELRQFAQGLADLCDRRIDILNPFVDLQLPNGIRAHIVIPPIADHGTHISLRIPRSHKMSLVKLLAHQDEEVVRILRQVIAAHKSVIVCGSTGSGKTTLLRALLCEVSANERIVVIEDVQELNVQHNHCVNLQGRNANSEMAGEVTMRQLVRQSLRMRPDRIVVGEIRGVEIVDLFAALNTGHAGSAATIHANSAGDVVARLHMLGLMAGMTTEAIHAQIASALDIVIEVVRVGERRVVKEIGVLNVENGVTHYSPALVCWPTVRRAEGFEELEAMVQR